MPVEVSTRLFLPGRHSVVITATDSFQKRAEKVVEYTLKQGPVNGMHFVIHRVLLKVSITKLLRYSRTKPNIGNNTCGNLIPCDSSVYFILFT